MTSNLLLQLRHKQGPCHVGKREVDIRWLGDAQRVHDGLARARVERVPIAAHILKKLRGANARGCAAAEHRAHAGDAR